MNGKISFLWVAARLLPLLPCHCHLNVCRYCDPKWSLVKVSQKALFSCCIKLSTPVWCSCVVECSGYVFQDEISSFYYNSDTKLYWVSFLDGMQRVLLFTEDVVVATLAQQVIISSTTVSSDSAVEVMMA